jgi:hypothetical protein
MVNEIEVESWSEFEKAIDEYIASPAWSGKFAFRGQGNANWTLRPSLLRSVTGDYPKLGLRSIERQATEHFAARAANHHPFAPDRDPGDWLAWWPLMQHHGAPTRLLDWTKSPYVAAYFAVEDLKADEDGAVYLVHTELVNQAATDATGKPLLDLQFIDETWDDIMKKPHLIKFITPQRMTTRMAAQQGLYSICKSPLMAHDEAISNVLPSEKRDDYFRRLTIPGRLKREVARQLQYMNITASSLFPGIDGLGRQLREFIAHQIFTDSSLGTVLKADPALRDRLLDTVSRATGSLADPL